MNRIWILMVVVAYPVIAMAQTGSPGASARSDTYQPGYSGGTTAAGSALSGMASVISAKGDYNLSTSAAAINMTQAQKNEIQNRQQYTNAYFDMRATNKAAREKEAGPRPTMEQIVKMSKEGVPKPLSPSEMDAISGKIAWPSTLQQDNFAGGRSEIEQLFSTRARYGGLGYSDQMKVREVVDSMFVELKTQIRQIPPQDYVACRDFLSSLSFAATKSELQ
jgi:hypothetical protein